MQKLYIFLIVVLCINLSLQVNKHQLKKAKSMNATGTYENTECPTTQVNEWDASTEQMRCMDCDEVLKGSTKKWGWCQCPEASNYDTRECQTCAENDDNSEYHSEGDYGWCKCKDGFDWGYEGKCEKIDCEAKKKGTVWNAAKHQCECPTGERWDWDHHKCEAVVCKIPGTVFDEMSKHCECPRFHHLCPKKGSHKHHAHASNDTTVQTLLKKKGADHGADHDADENQWECKFECPKDREEKDSDCVCKANSHEHVHTFINGTDMFMGSKHVSHCQCDTGFGQSHTGEGECKPCDAPKVSDHGWCSCPAMMRTNWESEAQECVCDDYNGAIEGEAGVCQCPEGQSWVFYEGSSIHGLCQQATASGATTTL